MVPAKLFTPSTRAWARRWSCATVAPIVRLLASETAPPDSQPDHGVLARGIA
jgi:hypothetical protein